MNKLLPTSIFLLLTQLTFSQNARFVETINEVWQFQKGEVAAPFSNNNDGWTTLNLPHTWNTEDILDEERGYYRDVGWYKKDLKVLQRFPDQRVYLRFEAVNQVTQVYVNGEEAGPAHIGGYTPFVYDITDLLDPTGSNQLAVKVNNAHNDDIIPLNADFNFYGGIYRDVYLIYTRPVHFDMLDHGSSGVYITTPVVSEEAAKVKVRSKLVNDGRGRQEVSLRLTLLDDERKTVTRISETATINAQDEEEVVAEMNVKDPNLWSPDHPYLYALKTEILNAEGEVIDKVEHPVGLRWYRFDAKKGFFLNGKRLKLIGTNRHQDYEGIGNALPNEMHRYDMKMLKEMGINFLRISHYPQDPAILEMCDRFGFIASQEIPFVNGISTSEAFLDNAKNMMRENIRAYYNHPCIVAWCTGNETTQFNRQMQEASFRERLREVHMELASLVEEEDPTRYTYTVVHKSIDYHKELDIIHTDIVGFNKYFGWYDDEIEDIERNLKNLVYGSLSMDSTRSFILSEYGAGADPRLRSFHPSRFDFSVEYQLAFHKEHLKYILAMPEIVGANVWNFADFQVEARSDAVPHINSKGIVTVDRRPKDTYYFYKTILSDEPYIVIPSKLWTHRSGRADAKDTYTCTQPVEIFGNIDQAELFLNNESLGKRSFNDHSATWQVPFVHGKNLLEIRGEEDGKILKDFLYIDFTLQPYHLKDKMHPFEEIAVNVGSFCYFIEESNNDYLWLPDKPYEPGSWGYVNGRKFMNRGRNTFGSPFNVYGTKIDPIYQTQQVGIDAYQFDVPKGNYEVTLYFAELERNQELNRLFDVGINGQKVLPDFSIKDQYEAFRAVEKRYLIEVTDGGGLRVEFEAKNEEAVLNGIKVRKVY